MNGLSTLARINSEPSPVYNVVSIATERDNKIIDQALDILKRRLREPGTALSSPGTVIDYLRLAISEREYEVFYCVYLDTRHCVIDIVSEFRGTIDGCSIPPRDIVKGALYRNAAAVIFAHNHPSGCAEPSQADIQITGSLKG